MRYLLSLAVTIVLSTSLSNAQTCTFARDVLYPFLQKLFADCGYQGPVFQKALAKAPPHLENALAFLRLASIRLMLRKLCNQ